MSNPNPSPDKIGAGNSNSKVIVISNKTLGVSVLYNNNTRTFRAQISNLSFKSPTILDILLNQLSFSRCITPQSVFPRQHCTNQNILIVRLCLATVQVRVKQKFRGYSRQRGSSTDSYRSQVAGDDPVCRKPKGTTRPTSGTGDQSRSGRHNSHSRADERFDE